MSYKILVTEDDEFTASFLKTSLTKMGYSPIEIATNGEEAVQKCDSFHPDVVLMDIELPGQLDGITATDIIRQKHNIPVIYVTSNSNHEILKRALASNPNGYVLKPINGEQLFPLIEMSIRRNNLELELRNLNEQLEEKVTERTKELSSKNIILEQEIQRRESIENELKDSLAKEKELNELKSRIVSIVSHEFKTPLTTILSSAQLIEYHLNKNSEPAKIEEHSHTIIKSVKLLTEIINETLFIGKSDSNQIQINKTIFYPKEFISKIIHDLEIGVGKEHQFIVYHSDEIPSKLQTDTRMLKQILNNILSNSIKYSPKNPLIKISSSWDSEGWKIDITDHGIGIPIKDQKFLFKMFNRASNTTNIEGTGIGLAIVKRCIDLLGGKISVHSEENKGATFSILLPNSQVSEPIPIS